MPFHRMKMRKSILTADGAISLERPCVREERVTVKMQGRRLDVREALKLREDDVFVWEFSVPQNSFAMRPFGGRDIPIPLSSSRSEGGPLLDRLDYDRLKALWPKASPRRLALPDAHPVIYIDVDSHVGSAEILLTAWFEA